jgi:hypothetical protein
MAQALQFSVQLGDVATACLQTIAQVIPVPIKFAGHRPSSEALGKRFGPEITSHRAPTDFQLSCNLSDTEPLAMKTQDVIVPLLMALSPRLPPALRIAGQLHGTFRLNWQRFANRFAGWRCQLLSRLTQFALFSIQKTF